jgi:glucose/arabinose dehydrogenase
MRSLALGFACFAVCALGLPTPAAALPPGYRLETVLSGLNIPVALRFAPDGRLFYIELLTGRIMMHPDPRSPTAVVWATVPVQSDFERGLLGMTFHPDFPDSPYVYLFHTNPSPLENRLIRLRDHGVSASDLQVLLTLPAGPIHNGGRLAFGPDRMLYLTYGDQLDIDAAADPDDVRGKILRLGFVGQPAPGNPYGPGNPAALKGVRNVFGVCFDPEVGTGYFTENGPQCDDEINLIALGQDYGWSFSDTCNGQPAGAFPAITRFTPTIAPTGCCVYRGSVYGGHLEGDLFFGGYKDGNLWRIVFAPGNPAIPDTIEAFVDGTEAVFDVTVGPDGALWYSYNSGIGRIAPPGAIGVGPGADAADLSVAPNPFAGTLRLRLRGAVERVQVLDLQGRRVREWAPQGRTRLEWDGRDASGRPAPAGVYLVRAEGTGLSLSRRVVRVARSQ